MAVAGGTTGGRVGIGVSAVGAGLEQQAPWVVFVSLEVAHGVQPRLGVEHSCHGEDGLVHVAHHVAVAVGRHHRGQQLTPGKTNRLALG